MLSRSVRFTISLTAPGSGRDCGFPKQYFAASQASGAHHWPIMRLGPARASNKESGLAVVAGSIGDGRAAFAHVEDALVEQSMVMSWLGNPFLEGMRDDPRNRKIFERVGLKP